MTAQPPASGAASLAPRLTTPLHTAFQGAHALWWPHARSHHPSAPPPGPAPAPRIFLLFIPGNPGLASYYVPYLDAIYRSPELRGQVEILAVSHRGHAPLPLSGGSFPAAGAAKGRSSSNTLWEALSGLGSGSGSGSGSASESASAESKRTDLQAQIDHKIAAVKLIRSIYPKRQRQRKQGGGGEEADAGDVKLVLLGHSVGAYIGLRTLEDRGEEIDGLQILFPTVMHIAKAPKAETLPLLLITNPLVQKLVLPVPLLILSLLPSLLLLTLLRLLAGMPSGGLSTTLSFLTTPGAPLSAAQMARDEFLTIRDLPPSLLASVRALRARGGSIRSYWARGDEDPWAPSGHREAAEGVLALRRVPLPPHLWGVSPGEVADLTSPRSKGERSLRQRTLNLGGTITRAAGRRIVASSRLASRAALGAAGVGSGSGGGSDGREVEGLPGRHSKSLFEGSENSSGPTSPTNPRSPQRRTSATTTARGTYPRRPSLSLAKAKRSLDGSITLELPQGEDWGFLEGQGDGSAGAGGGGQGGGGQVQEDSSEGEGDSVLDASPSKVGAGALRARKHGEGAVLHDSPLEEKDEEAALSGGGAGAGKSSAGRAKEKDKDKDREGTLTSTVCNIGMPHAFCLRHGEVMGGISAHWIAEDHL